MELFGIQHLSGLVVRLARFPVTKYVAFVEASQDLQTLYSAAGGDVKLLLRRKGVKQVLEWCLDQFKVVSYNPEKSWDWITTNEDAVQALFFDDKGGGIRGALFEFAIRPPELPPNITPITRLPLDSSGDPFMDMLSGLVFQGQFQDAIAVMENYSLQDVARLQWRLAEIANPQERLESRQKAAQEQLEEQGVLKGFLDDYEARKREMLHQFNIKNGFVNAQTASEEGVRPDEIVQEGDDNPASDRSPDRGDDSDQIHPPEQAG